MELTSNRRYTYDKQGGINMLNTILGYIYTTFLLFIFIYLFTRFIHVSCILAYEIDHVIIMNTKRFVKFIKSRRLKK